MLCSARQPVAGACRRCDASMAKYFCSVCNFWDDAEDVYHCPFCNLCRRGKGWGKDFFHCMQCNSCVSLTMGPHDCGAKTRAGGGGGGGNTKAGDGAPGAVPAAHGHAISIAAIHIATHCLRGRVHWALGAGAGGKNLRKMSSSVSAFT